jgi:hypothetical protein
LFLRTLTDLRCLSIVVEPQAPQRIRQFVVTDQAADSYRSLHRQAARARPGYALGETVLQPLQAPIAFVLGELGAVYRDDQGSAVSVRFDRREDWCRVSSAEAR